MRSFFDHRYGVLLWLSLVLLGGAAEPVRAEPTAAKKWLPAECVQALAMSGGTSEAEPRGQCVPWQSLGTRRNRERRMKIEQSRVLLSLLGSSPLLPDGPWFSLLVWVTIPPDSVIFSP